MEQVVLEVGTRDSLARRVYDAMQHIGYRRQLANVDCRSEGSTVVLCGLVSSFYIKQVAQSVAAKVHGVTRVINDLQVAELAPHSRR